MLMRALVDAAFDFDRQRVSRWKDGTSFVAVAVILKAVMRVFPQHIYSTIKLRFKPKGISFKFFHPVTNGYLLLLTGDVTNCFFRASLILVSLFGIGIILWQQLTMQ